MSYCPYCMTPASGDSCPSCRRRTVWTPGPGQLPAGTVLDGGGLHRYITGAALGQGGFGVTYIGLDPDLNRRVAIKECFPRHCARRSTDGVSIEPLPGTERALRETQDSFLNEARLLARQDELGSIVSVSDFFRANGTAYMVMEYLDGVPLYTKVRTLGRIPAQVLLKRVEPLIADLNALHRSGVIHRDISPDNIMWMPDGSLKLIDFGSARYAAGEAPVMVKHGFAPVEQYITSGQGAWTDVYALAATIYYCVTGVTPPHALERLENDSLRRPTEYGAKLSLRQENALLWGLEVQPQRRPQSMDAFSTVLYADPPQVADGDEADGGDGGADGGGGTEGGKKRLSKKYIIAGAAAALVVLAIGVTSALTGRDGPAISGEHTGPGSAQSAPVLLPADETTPQETLGVTEPLEADGVTEDGWHYAFDGEGVVLTGFSGTESASFSMPDMIEELPVTGIAAGACGGLDGIEYVFLPVYVEHIDAGAFSNCGGLAVVYAFSSPEVESGAFDGCGSLAAVVYPEETPFSALDWRLPGVRFVANNSETGDGVLSVLQLAADGALYAITESDTAVLMGLPAGTAEYSVPETVAGYPMTWVNSGALAGQDSPTIHMTAGMGFDFSLFSAANWEFGDAVDSNSFSFQWYMSCLLASMVNSARPDGAAEMKPVRSYVQAAMERSAELQQSQSHTRPDGTEWSTVFDEYGLSPTYRSEFIREFDAAADGALDSALDASIEAVTAYHEEYETYYTELGAAISTVSGSAHICL